MEIEGPPEVVLGNLVRGEYIRLAMRAYGVVGCWTHGLGAFKGVMWKPAE